MGLFKHNSANAEICVAIIQNNKSKGASRSQGNCSVHPQIQLVDPRDMGTEIQQHITNLLFFLQTVKTSTIAS